MGCMWRERRGGGAVSHVHAIFRENLRDDSSLESKLLIDSHLRFMDPSIHIAADSTTSPSAFSSRAPLRRATARDEVQKHLLVLPPQSRPLQPGQPRNQIPRGFCKRILALAASRGGISSIRP